MQSDHKSCAHQSTLAFEESSYCQHTPVGCGDQGSLPGKTDKDSIEIAQHDLCAYYNDVILLLSESSYCFCSFVSMFFSLHRNRRAIQEM